MEENIQNKSLAKFIELRLANSNLQKNDMNYVGFDMSKTHSQNNDPITEHNEKILRLFGDYLPLGIENYFDCWKGTCFFAPNKSFNENIEQFGGMSTFKILEWLIVHSKEYVNFWESEKLKKRFFLPNKYDDDDPEEEIYRLITAEQRYNVLKRQKWKCNICGEKLKYNSNSDWEGKVAHIDHIHPFSKRASYPNGEANINELSNLQALCPDCNLKKRDKMIG
jgi:hypothetical protein